MFMSNYIQTELRKTRKNRMETRNMVKTALQIETLVNTAVKFFIMLS